MRSTERDIALLQPWAGPTTFYDLFIFSIPTTSIHPLQLERFAGWLFCTQLSSTLVPFMCIASDDLLLVSDHAKHSTSPCGDSK